MNVRFLSILLALAALNWVGPLQAQDPKSDEIRRNAEQAHRELARQFAEFQRQVSILKSRLERSLDPEDQSRAIQLQKVLDRADSAGIRIKFARLQELLRKPAFSLQDYEEAARQNKILAKDLGDLLELFSGHHIGLAGEIDAIKSALDKLDKLIDNQKGVNTLTEMGKTDPKENRDLQKGVTNDTKDLKDFLDRMKAGKNPPSSDDAKLSPSSPKEGTGSDKSDAKPGGNPDKAKDGDPMSGSGPPSPGAKPMPSQPAPGAGRPSDNDASPKINPSDDMDDPLPQEPQPGGNFDPPIGKKHIMEAHDKMKKSEDKIGPDNPAAGKYQQDAIRDLQRAKDELEKRLKQLRLDEMEVILAALKARCEKMLAMQIDVLDHPTEGTKATHRAILGNADQRPNDANFQTSLRLAGQEKEIITEVDACLLILKTDGTGVAFPVAFEQIREDMRNVLRRLDVADVGKINQDIQQDIIDSLKDMVEALKRKQADLQQQKQQPTPPADPQPPTEPSLLKKLEELKLIRAMQDRLNKRTHKYSELFPGQEQPTDPNLRREVNELRARQEQIFGITNRIQRGDNN